MCAILTNYLSSIPLKRKRVTMTTDDHKPVFGDKFKRECLNLLYLFVTRTLVFLYAAFRFAKRRFLSIADVSIALSCELSPPFIVCVRIQCFLVLLFCFRVSTSESELHVTFVRRPCAALAREIQQQGRFSPREILGGCGSGICLNVCKM